MRPSSKSSLPLALVLLALALTALGVYFLTPKSTKKSLQIPSKQVEAYSDLDELKVQNPKPSDSLASLYSESKIIESPHLISFHNYLRPHHAWPYVGFKVTLGDTLTGKGCLDWTQYNHMEITMESSNSEGLYIQIYTQVPEELKHYPLEILRMTQLPTPVSTTPTPYLMELSKFATPLWWKKSKKIPLLDNEAYLQKVCMISFSQSIDFQKRPGADTLNIYQIKLLGETKPQFTLGISLLALALLSLILPILKPKSFGIIENSHAQPIEVKNHEDELKQKIQSYYEANYMSTDDSAAHFAGQIGLHPKKLQEILRNDYKTTHKAWLNHLRIQEASRLLIESDANISEIADMVGFRTTTHFNRVFKEKTDLSPGDFRLEKRKEE